MNQPERENGSQSVADAGTNIIEYGGPELPDEQQDIYTLAIVGEIEGHVLLPPQSKTTKYEHILPLLAHVEQAEKYKGVLLIMNTMGGDVEAGLAIAEMIAGMGKPSVSLVLGGGHSIGVPLAVSADYSFITPTATMTVHPIRMSGLIISVAQTYEYFNKMQQRVLDFTIKHSRITSKKLNMLMLQTMELANDIGTVLIGKESVDCGLIDAVGGVQDAIKKLRAMIEAGERLKNTKRRRSGTIKQNKPSKKA